jgi:hypothetical protein
MVLSLGPTCWLNFAPIGDLARKAKQLTNHDQGNENPLPGNPREIAVHLREMKVHLREMKAHLRGMKVHLRGMNARPPQGN